MTIRIIVLGGSIELRICVRVGLTKCLRLLLIAVGRLLWWETSILSLSECLRSKLLSVVWLSICRGLRLPIGLPKGLRLSILRRLVELLLSILTLRVVQLRLRNLWLVVKIVLRLIIEIILRLGLRLNKRLGLYWGLYWCWLWSLFWWFRSKCEWG